MLTISGGKSSKGAAEYFKSELVRDGASPTEHTGVWFGRAAAALGLEGAVSEEAFRRLLEGRHPLTGDLLLPQRRARRYGAWDLTFAAPKSVSLAALVGGDHRLYEAHRNAVDFALSLVEDYARGRAAPDAFGELTATLAAARFTHVVSREHDPHLHTHCVVANLTLGRRGWRALAGAELVRLRSLGTKAYRAALANQLELLGYGVEVGRGERAVEIEGVSREAVDRFSTRHRQIVEHRARAGRWSHEADRVAQIATRAPKREARPEDLASVWAETAAAVGLDARALVARALASADGRAGLTEGEAGARALERVGAVAEALDMAARAELERESVTTEPDLVRRALDANFGRFFPQEIVGAVRRLRDRGELVDLDVEDPRSGERRPSGKVTSREVVRLEREIVGWLREGQGACEPIAPGADTGPRGSGEDAFRLNDGEQQEAVRMILESHDWLVGVQGYAGVGKTFAVRRVIRAAREAGYDVDSVAPYTGHVAALADEGIVDARTVARFLQEEAPEQRSRPRLLIVDEAGTLDLREMRRLLAWSREAGARVVLLGDRAQHQAVGAGNPFRLLQEARMRYAELRDIQRQKVDELRWAVEDAADGRMVEAVRRLKGIEHAGAARDELGRLLDSDGTAIEPSRDVPGRRTREPRGRPLAAVEVADPSGRVVGRRTGSVVEIADEHERNLAVAREYCKYLEDPTRVLCVAPSNRERVRINAAVRASMRESGRLSGEDRVVRVLRDSGTSKSERKYAINYEPGQRVFYSKGSRRRGIRKYSFATVVASDRRSNQVTVRLDTGAEVTYSPRDLYGVAIYDVETRRFAVGDRIQYRAPDDSAAERIPNGALGRIVAIDEHGRATIALDARGGDRFGTIDLTRPVQIDHGYCVTSYSSQGKTVERVFVAVDATRGSRKLVNRELGYVATSRAKFEALVFTDSADRLDAALDRTNPKFNVTTDFAIARSAADFVDDFRPRPMPGAPAPHTEPSLTEPPAERGPGAGHARPPGIDFSR